MLLTQSHVSVITSSVVVIIFTFLLFLSGYVLQQQTVKGLQSAIKPRFPQPPPSLNTKQTILPEPSASSRLFARSPGHVAYPDLDRDTSKSGTNLNWKRLAHVQLARNHHDVCNAIMVLAELHRMKSPARRVLLFPRPWAEEKEAGKRDMLDPFVDSSRRLMRLAARRYGVELIPVSPITLKSTDGQEVETYSLASVFDLQAQFDRVLTVETPGLVLDAEPLDALLGFTEDTPFAMLHDVTEADGVHPEDLYLLAPSKPTYSDLTKRLTEMREPGFNDTLLSSLFSDPVLLASRSEKNVLIRSVEMLHHATSDFKQNDFLSEVSYIRFSDSKLPGPEFDVPWSQKVAARPKNKDADWVWTSLYGKFAQKRMEVCGLDLESWRP